jgi:ribosome recycling factor
MIKNNDKFIVFIREYDDENKNVTSSIVYNTEEDARDVIKDYELSHQDKKYAIKLIRGEILDSIFKEI